jgi:hypothetical protein
MERTRTVNQEKIRIPGKVFLEKKSGKLLITLELEEDFLQQINPSWTIKNSTKNLSTIGTKNNLLKQPNKERNQVDKKFDKSDKVQHILNNNTLLDLVKIHPKKSKLSIVERNKKYLPLAQQLAKVILTKKNIKNTTQKINQWTHEMRILEELNEVDYDRIENVLDWYKKNIGGEYIPVVESGYSLRMKFSRLEDAMNRKTPVKQEEICPYKFKFGIDHGKYAGCSDCLDYKPKVWGNCKMVPKR